MTPDRPRMEWSKLLDSTRFGIKDQKPDIRSPFQRDIDRITFSDAFRRLARKTQVHPLNENDHIHTRLTHSLEVTTVGKTLGELVGHFLAEGKELPEGITPTNVGEVVQAACLAHDIGNPPFGHSGEAAIKDWFADHPEAVDPIPVACRTDFTKFDGNAMAVRILLSTGFYQQGMSPTLAVAGTLLKYPWPSAFDSGKDKFSFFQTEADAVRSIAKTIGLLDLGGRYARHPLAYLMEAADDICYRIIDLEDATELSILPDTFMFDSFGEVLGLTDNPERRERYEGLHFRQRNSIIRAKLINQATLETVEVFKDHYDAIMHGTLEPSDSLMGLAHGLNQTIHDVYKGVEDRLFLSRRKAVLELGAQNVLGTLLDLLMAEAKKLCTGEPSTNKKKVRILLGESIVDAILQKGGCHYEIIMSIADYVSGMTDHYASDLCQKFLGLGN